MKNARIEKQGEILIFEENEKKQKLRMEIERKGKEVVALHKKANIEGVASIYEDLLRVELPPIPYIPAPLRN